MPVEETGKRGHDMEQLSLGTWYQNLLLEGRQLITLLVIFSVYIKCPPNMLLKLSHSTVWVNLGNKGYGYEKIMLIGVTVATTVSIDMIQVT